MGQPADAPSRGCCVLRLSQQPESPLLVREHPADQVVDGETRERGPDQAQFDEWNRPQRAAGRAARSVTDGRMPPAYYTWFGLHPNAKLSAAEIS